MRRNHKFACFVDKPPLAALISNSRKSIEKIFGFGEVEIYLHKSINVDIAPLTVALNCRKPLAESSCKGVRLRNNHLAGDIDKKREVVFDAQQTPVGWRGDIGVLREANNTP